jgi:PAS domain S-box-containing protein
MLDVIHADAHTSDPVEGSSAVKDDQPFTEGDAMPKLPPDVFRRYGCAVLSVGLAAVSREVFHPALADRYPFLFFFVAMATAAAYGGYGPSLLALILSWLSIDYLILSAGVPFNFFQTKYQIALAFSVTGLLITVLGGALRAARERGRAACFELQRASETQKAEREWLQITLASIADAVITTDPDGLVISLNPVAVRLTAWSLDEAVGRPLREVFRTIHQASWRTDDLPIAKVVGDGEVILSDDEVVLVARDGTARSVEHNAAPIRDSNGKVKGVVITFRDVTERYRIEQAQRESEDRFRTLADATPVLIWGSDTDRRCDYFNKQWLDFTGRSADEEQGEGWSLGVHPDDRKRCLRTYSQAFDARRPFTMEYRLKRHDGEYRWVINTGVPRFTPDGTFSGYIGSCIDINDRKRTEEELRQSDRRKEEFLAVLSHELRNPLAPIQTAVDLLEESGTSKAGSERELAMIKRQLGNLKRLVDDLMDISRVSRGKIELRKELVDLAAVIDGAVEAVRPLFDEHRQEFQVSIPEQSIFLEADSTRLEQILLNLLINTSKYTPQGGRIWLDVEQCQREVGIRVRDTGIGIEPDLLPKVFDLFLQGERRAGRSHEGGGIGLNLVQKLVQLHGGTITAHSRGSGMGSEFVVKLPAISRVRAKREESPEVIQPEVSKSLPRWRVLIVDDNVPAADSLGRLLSEFLGQDVRIAYGGKSALEMARLFLPQVILLDLEMAGMDGYEVAQRLREQSEFSEALIVAVSGWAQEEYRRRSRETGFDVHVVKPVTARDLRIMLADLKPKREKRWLLELVPDLANG